MNQSDLRVDLNRDEAIVYLDQEIDNRLIIACIAAIDELVDKYDYRRVELRIVSPGGMATSMDYFLGEMRKWERKTTLVTRALTNAESAAAIILSLGNERRAEQRSRLLYHNIRLPMKKDDALTARVADTLARKMHRSNEEWVERLATRACEISREDWIECLKAKSSSRGADSNDKARFSPQGAGFDSNEHDFCAKLFNLPVERHVCCLLHQGDIDPKLRQWFALPVLSSLTGTGAGTGAEQVFHPHEVWNYIRGSFDDNRDDNEIGAINEIVETIVREMRENGEGDHGLVQRLRKKIQEYFGTADEDFVFGGESFEYHKDGAILGYSNPVEILYASPIVTVALSPEWKIENLMAALLDRSRDEDCSLKKRLCAVYRNLFELDQPISPRFAMALGLIDGIGDEKAFGRHRSDDAPKTEEQHDEETFRKHINKEGNALPVYEWRTLYPNGVSLQNLCRHTLNLGETGSGKTRSGILPVVKAVVETANESAKSPIGCMLVIDPKKEIGDYLDVWARQKSCENVKVHKLHENAKEGHSRICLDLMAYEELPKDFTDAHYIDRANAIFRMVASLIPNHAAGVLLNRTRGGNNDFWDQQGVQMASVLVAILMMLNDLRGKYGCQCIPRLVDTLRVEKRSLRTEPLMAQRKPLMDLVEDAARGERNILHSSKRLLGIFGSSEGIEVLQTLVSKVSEIVEEKEGGPLSATTLRGILNELDLIQASSSDDRYFQPLIATTNNCFFQIAEGVAAKSLFFGVEPGWEERSTLDFRKAVKIDKSNLDIFVYSPDLSRSRSELIGRSLKASYFAAVLNDPDRVKGLDRKPGNSDHVKSYVGYIADEFHRFITDDMRHGEQSFLDTCRSYGGFCTLACQSVESMRHALLSFGGSSDKVNSSIGILLNNTATKLFFRATDIATMDRLSALVPDGTWGSVLNWQPLSMLSLGECYAALVDGRTKRKQLDWVR